MIFTTREVGKCNVIATMSCEEKAIFTREGGRFNVRAVISSKLSKETVIFTTGEVSRFNVYKSYHGQ